MALPTIVRYIVFFFAPLALWFVVNRAVAASGDRKLFGEYPD